MWVFLLSQIEPCQTVLPKGFLKETNVTRHVKPGYVTENECWVMILLRKTVTLLSYGVLILFGSYTRAYTN